MFEKIATYPQAVNMGTALPSSPTNGDQFILVDSLSAPTYQWRLQYVAAKSSNKWVFVGGTSLFAEVSTLETRASTAYGDLATAGPSVTVPVAGSYRIDIFSQITTAAVAGTLGVFAAKLGSAAATDEEAAVFSTSAALTTYGSVGQTFVRTLAASDVVKVQYKTGDGTNLISFQRRRLHVTPVAVGG